GLLRRVADRRRGLAEDLAVLRLDHPRRDFQQGGLAGAVAPYQRDLVAGRSREIGAVEKRRAAKGQPDAVKGKKRWCHGSHREGGNGMSDQQGPAGSKTRSEGTAHFIG